MQNEISKWMAKAGESYSASEFLLNRGYFSIAASQAFYSMFYIAKALLCSKGLTFSRESRVVSSFGKEFKKTGLLNNDFHEYLIGARKIRDNNDFRVDAEISKKCMRDAGLSI